MSRRMVAAFESMLPHAQKKTSTVADKQMRSVFQALSYHDRTMRQPGMNEFATLAAGAVGLSEAAMLWLMTNPEIHGNSREENWIPGC